MRIAVTGGSGLVGRAIVRRLADDNDVINIDIAAPGTTGGGLTTAEHAAVDVLDLPALASAIRGADAVIHAAAIPGPSFGTPERITEINVEGSRNVALAADREDVRRIVFISSESVLGFVFSEGRTAPRYLPVDEAHPLAPSEAYGRSKLLAETVLARQAPSEATVVCLRPPWVWVAEEYEKLRVLTESPSRWWDGLWAYVHGDDLATAAGLAAVAEIERGFHPVYVAAPDNGTVFPTAELVRQYYPDVPFREHVTEFGSLLSSGAVNELLGFRPSMSWREFLR